MDSLRSSLPADRVFQNFLLALTKRIFYSDKTYTDDVICEQLYNTLIESGDITRADIDAEINSFEELLKRAGEGYWDVSKMEVILKRVKLDTPHANIVLGYWSNEREKIHNSLLLANTFNNSVTSLKWRIDVEAANKKNNEVNDPTALFEIQLKKGASDKTSPPTVAKFEMNRVQVAEMVNVFDQIQKKIDEASY
jgi:hypothetical protein